VIRTLGIDELTADRVDSGRVGAGTGVEAHEALPGRLIGQPERACVESRFLELGLIDYRLTEYVVCATVGRLLCDEIRAVEFI